EPFRHSIYGALARAPPPPRLRHSRPALPTAWTSAPSAMPILDEEETGIGRATPGCPGRRMASRPWSPERALLKGARAAVSDWRWHGARPGRWDVQWQPMSPPTGRDWITAGGGPWRTTVQS